MRRPSFYLIRIGLLTCLPVVNVCTKVTSQAELKNDTSEKEAIQFSRPSPKKQAELRRMTQAILASFEQKSTQADKIAKIKKCYDRESFISLLAKETQKIGGIPRSQERLVLWNVLKKLGMPCGFLPCNLSSLGEKKLNTDQEIEVIGENVERILTDAYKYARNHPQKIGLTKSTDRATLLGSFSPGTSSSSTITEGGPEEVLYKVAHRQFDSLKGTIKDPTGILSFSLKPSDLKKARRINCLQDFCEVVVDAPFKINVNPPKILGAEISMIYSRDFEKSGAVTQTLEVESEIPVVSLNGIVSLSVEVDATLEQSPSTNQEIAIKDLDCGAKIECELGVINIEASVDRDGLEFEASVGIPSLTSKLVKISQEPLFDFKRHYHFSRLPQPIKDVVQALKNQALNINPDHADMQWDQFGPL